MYSFHAVYKVKIVVIALLLVGLLLSFTSSAQDTTSQSAQQLWPEVDVFYKLNQRFRLFALVSGTKLDKSYYSEGAFAMHLDYFAFPAFRKINPGIDSTRGYFMWMRAGYYYSATTPSAKKQSIENTIQTEVNNRFYPGWHTMITLRNRLDWRFINGELKPRYRPRFRWEREFRTDYLQFVAYTDVEYFLNVDESNQDRFRYSIGGDLKVSHAIIFETYYLHQFGNGTKVLPLDAISVVLKFFLATKREHSTEKK